MPSSQALLGFIFASLFCLQASAVCYLEDTSSTCSVCWKTTFSSAEDSVGVTKMAECPDSIHAAFDTALPHEMYAGQDYPVTFSLQLNPSAVDVVPSQLKDGSKVQVPHANIHSCVASRGACTPFVSNTPGLSTHTPATVGDFDSSGNAVFDGLVNLDMDNYVIIAHLRFFTPTDEVHGKASKYDVAVGVQREVMKKKIAVSADAWIMAGVVGFMILLFGGAIFYMVKRGVVNLDKIMAMLFSDVVTLPTDIVCGMADAAAFTISCTTIGQDENLLHIVPVCWLFCGIAWLVSTHNMLHDLSYMKMMYDEKNNSDRYQRLMMLRMSRKWVSGCKTVSQDLNQAGKKKMARRLSYEMETIADDSVDHRKAVFAFDVADRDYERRRRTITSIILESLPITALQCYINIAGDASTSGGAAAVLTLLLAALLLGCKLQGLGDYGHANERKILAMQNFEALFDVHLKNEALNRWTDDTSPGSSKAPSQKQVEPAKEPTGVPDRADSCPTEKTGEADMVVMDVAETDLEAPSEANTAASNFGWNGENRQEPAKTDPDQPTRPTVLGRSRARVVPLPVGASATGNEAV